MSSMSWISCTVSWIPKLAKLYCKFDELAKLRMSSISLSCTVSWILELTVRQSSKLDKLECKFDKLPTHKLVQCKFDESSTYKFVL